MPELGTPGSVRGVLSNGHPYRNPRPSPAAPACGKPVAASGEFFRHRLYLSAATYSSGSGVLL